MDRTIYERTGHNNNNPVRDGLGHYQAGAAIRGKAVFVYGTE